MKPVSAMECARVGIPRDDHRCGFQVRPARRIHRMVQRGDDGVVTDERTVANHEAALVLEPAAGVDEDVLPEPDTASEIAGERREQADGGIHLVADQFTEQGADASLVVVGPVEFRGEDAPVTWSASPSPTGPACRTAWTPIQIRNRTPPHLNSWNSRSHRSSNGPGPTATRTPAQ